MSTRCGQELLFVRVVCGGQTPWSGPPRRSTPADRGPVSATGSLNAGAARAKKPTLSLCACSAASTRGSPDHAHILLCCGLAPVSHPPCVPVQIATKQPAQPVGPLQRAQAAILSGVPPWLTICTLRQRATLKPPIHLTASPINTAVLSRLYGKSCLSPILLVSMS